MQLYLDTANLGELREAASWGIVSGVTTNPSLMAKEKGADFQRTIQAAYILNIRRRPCLTIVI
jgi:transaldolase